MARNAFEQAGKNLAVVIHAGANAGAPGLHRIGAAATADIKRTLSQPGRGAIYTRRGRVHQASAPGDPPAVDTGQYRASWDWAVRATRTLAELIIGTPDKRGPWLEHGTSRMLPRPHLRPVVERLVASAAVSRTLGRFWVEYQTRAARSVPRT